VFVISITVYACGKKNSKQAHVHTPVHNVFM